MRVRSILAAAALAIAAGAASADLGDLATPPVPVTANFPRPMPGRVIAPEKPEGFWLSLREWVRSKLEPVLPAGPR